MEYNEFVELIDEEIPGVLKRENVLEWFW